MKKIVIGILAHVDAGKTTLSESMLFLSKTTRHFGRVDHGDTFLDYDQQEKSRGITIYSKQARIKWKETEFIFVDTPGHMDFSTEMERTLQVLDYAIVVINGNDGIQAHTQTIWQLLEHYRIPSFLFVNKMDTSPYSKEELYQQIQKDLSTQCISFLEDKEILNENIALLDEEVLEEYMETNQLSLSTIQKLIKERKLTPTFFGSALKSMNVELFMDALNTYTLMKEYPQEFGARVFKISYDESKNQLTHMKITGGVLKNKEVFKEKEKIDQIRLYSGMKYEMVQSVEAGDICAVKGLKSFEAGDGLGFEKKNDQMMLTPYMTYRLVVDKSVSLVDFYQQMNQLCKEDPSLHLVYDENTKEMHVQLMGEIQIEILKNKIKEKYGYDVDFDEGKIVYKETILDTVEGVGHFEPLRHYAEVHLLIEPMKEGSGITFESHVLEDQLSRNWQRLILTHIQEKEHKGVLIGAPLTDVKISLVSGKAHLKHTEGGDFRQATYRAIRQGLKKAQSLLLEPYFHFVLEIPESSLSRALFDLETMNAKFESPILKKGMMVIQGEVPAVLMNHYQREVISYTKGKGRLSYQLSGYKPCHNQEEVIQQMQYDSEKDLDNPTGSIFCKHGAGFYVPYNEVEDYMHLPLINQKKSISNKPMTYSSSLSEDEELERIFTQTYGTIDRLRSQKLQTDYSSTEKVEIKERKKECLLVDGYNVIHAWDELRNLAQDNLDGARFRLMDMMCNYQGYRQCELILVFDAYKVKGNLGTSQKYHNIHIIYTKEAQTADMYIERATRKLSSEYNVIVATSDALEQLIVSGGGARRMSSRELKLELDYLNKTKQKEYQDSQKRFTHTPLDKIKS